MFCGKCGNQLPEGARFCGNCGATINQAPAQPNMGQAPVQPNVGQAPVQQPVLPYTAPSFGQGNSLGGTPLTKKTNNGLIFNIGVIICQIILLISWFGDSLSVFGYDTNLAEGLEFVDGEFLTVIAVIGSVLALIPAVIGLIKKSDKPILVPVTIIGALALIGSFIIIFIALSDTEGLIELNFLGTLGFLASIATLILPIVGRSVSK